MTNTIMTSRQFLLLIFIFFFLLPISKSAEPKRCYTSSCEGRNLADPLASSTSSFKSNGLFSFILKLLKLLMLICIFLVTLVIAIGTHMALLIFSSERLDRDIRRLVARLITRKPRGLRVVSSIGEVYKKVELKESMKPPGRNHTLCPICRAEYTSGETVVCLLECEHCFHIQCIDAWLQLHSSCPTCRIEVPTLRRVCD